MRFRNWLLRPVLNQLNKLKELITMNQAELAKALTDLKAQADKSKAEVVAKVGDLETALNNSGSTSPEVDAALAALKGSVQALDDLNPDAPATGGDTGDQTPTP